MSDHSRTLLDALIVARRWTAEECVQHFADTATAMGEPATLSATQLKRWRRGQLGGLPRPTACRVAERLFGFPAEDLIGPPPGFIPSLDLVLSRRALGVTGSSERAGSGGSNSVPGAGQHRKHPGGRPVTADPFLLDLDVERDPVMSAAHDASEHAANAGQAIEDTTLEQLDAEVVRLARSYATTPPMVMFAQLKRARDLTYLMLERTRRPTQITDLYLVAGQLSGLMAGASYDLGQPDAASEQARAAALTYGQVIDHNTLRAWARATLSMIAFWSGRPNAGVVHAQAGLEHTATGDAAVRLHAVAARSWALTGSRDEALAALRAADDARATTAATDDLAGSIGGEFVFGPARQELSAGATFLALDEPALAADHATAALGIYQSGPSEQRAVGGVHGARVDLGIAHALSGDVDGVLEAVGPTLELAAEHRTSRLNARLHRLRGHLASPRLRGSLRATQLADDVEGFLVTACGSGPRTLP